MSAGHTNVFSIFQIKDVRDHRKEDRMESFFLAETTKYLYLLFDTDNFIHNTGKSGTVINTPNGECIIDAGGYIFNTEAHPIDPAALYCCHDLPKMNLFDFSDLSSKRSLFRGETLDERIVTVKNNLNNEDSEGNSGESGVEVAGEGSASVLEIKTAENVSEVVETNETSLNDVELEESVADGSYNNSVVPNRVKQMDPQEMLERIRKEHRYFKNSTWEHNYKILSCKAQPFLQRLSILGEFFST